MNKPFNFNLLKEHRLARTRDNINSNFKQYNIKPCTILKEQVI